MSNHDWAGKSFEIIGNVILADTELNGHAATGIFIRGDPLEKSIIAENQFAHKPEVDDNPGFGVGSWGDAYALNVSSIADSNIVVGENYYNTTSPSPIPDFFVAISFAYDSDRTLRFSLFPIIPEIPTLVTFQTNFSL